jgi:Uma2 family endonuclease
MESEAQGLLMQLPTQRHLATVAEYFQYENAAENRHEYRNGEIVAMAGNTCFHVKIASNFIHRFGNALDGKPCSAMDSNLRIGIPRSARYTYPDVSIICGPPQMDPKDPDGMTVTNPRVVVEILSPSTEVKDRGEKFIKYQ